MNLSMDSRHEKFLARTLEILFPRKQKHRGIALRVLLEVRHRMHTDEKCNASEWKAFAERIGVDENDFQYAQNRLRDAQLVTKKGGHHEGEYTISTDFLDRLTKEWHEFLTVRQ